MTRKYHWVILAAALMTAACGDSPVAPTSVPNGGNTHDTAQSTYARFGVRNSDPCGDVTYVGPIRLPISVHGTTFNFSWLGADGATRGYEVQWQLDVANVYTDAGSTVVVRPEIELHVRTEGTYRFRVRGLFCNDQVGGWTDWVVQGTDDTEDHSTPPPIIICLQSVEGCYPPPPPCWVTESCPPPPPGDGDDDDDDDGDGHHGGGGGDDDGHHGPPPFEQYALCHVEFHGGRHPHYTEQNKTIHSEGEAHGHSNHENDYLGTCDGRYN